MRITASQGDSHEWLVYDLETGRKVTHVSAVDDVKQIIDIDYVTGRQFVTGRFRIPLTINAVAKVVLINYRLALPNPANPADMWMVYWSSARKHVDYSEVYRWRCYCAEPVVQARRARHEHGCFNDQVGAVMCCWCGADMTV